MIVGSALAGAAAAAYGELVLDISVPRASLAQIHVINVPVAIPTADLYRAFEARKKKYGPDSETVLTTEPPRLITTVSGKVVEQAWPPTEFGGAAGLFVVGRPGRLESTFPFNINPRYAPALGIAGRQPLEYFRRQFGSEFPSSYFYFDDRQAVVDRCVVLSAADLGWLGRLLRFRTGTFCVELWKGASPGSMLVGVALAKGDPWMRPFSRRVCRWLTTVALARVAGSDGQAPPDYAGCVLVDRPDRRGAAQTLDSHVYEVRGDGGLAYILPPRR